MKKRDPESTLKGRLALMTEDRDNFREQAEKFHRLYNDNAASLKVKEERFVAYKVKAERELQWHRQVIQELLSKVPGERT